MRSQVRVPAQPKSFPDLIIVTYSHYVSNSFYAVTYVKKMKKVSMVNFAHITVTYLTKSFVALHM